MCKVSDKIKFCTCVDDNIDIEELNHYWVLHRYNKDKNQVIMGMPVMPNYFEQMFIKINAEMILVNTLNTPEAFDKKIIHEKGDILEVVLCSNSNDGNRALYYNFRYTGKIWESIESDCFDLMSRFDEVSSGEIKEIS